MSQKYTIEDVKNRIFELSDGTVELLSDEYKNTQTNLTLKCKCGQLFYRSFAHINQRGSVYCDKCRRAILYHGKNEFDDVRKSIEATGCKWISGVYINQSSKLVLQCRKCGKLFEKTFRKFKNGETQCFECAMKQSADNRRKYTQEQAHEILKENGYTKIGKYINNQTPILCISRDGYECKIIIEQLLSKPIGHKQRKSNQDNEQWSGVIKDELRKRLKRWRTLIFKTYERKCPVSNTSTGKLVVHHLISMTTIFNEVAAELGINCSYKTLEDFESKQKLEDLIKGIKNRHNVYTGILLSEEVHKQFHTEYGYGENTPEQFNKFLLEHYDITLEEIQTKHIKRR